MDRYINNIHEKDNLKDTNIDFNNNEEFSLSEKLYTEFIKNQDNVLNKHQGTSYKIFDKKTKIYFDTKEDFRDVYTDNICAYGIEYCIFKASNLDDIYSKQYYINEIEKLKEYANLSERIFEGSGEHGIIDSNAIGFSSCLKALKQQYPNNLQVYTEKSKQLMEFAIDNRAELQDISINISPYKDIINYERKDNVVEEEHIISTKNTKNPVGPNILDLDGVAGEDIEYISKNAYFGPNPQLIQYRENTVEIILKNDEENFKILNKCQAEINENQGQNLSCELDGRTSENNLILKIYDLQNTDDFDNTKKEFISIVCAKFIAEQKGIDDNKIIHHEYESIANNDMCKEKDYNRELEDNESDFELSLNPPKKPHNYY